MTGTFSQRRRFLWNIAACGLLLANTTAPAVAGFELNRRSMGIFEVNEKYLLGTPTTPVTKLPGWPRSEVYGALRALAIPTLAVPPIALMAATTSPPALSPAPGSPLPWQPGLSVYKGSANLATGNVSLAHPVTGWGGHGPGVTFTLAFNSQSARTATLGPKWTHTYNEFITGTSPATIVYGDGREVSYTLSGGVYTAPAGFHETLVKNSNNTWTLTFKNGTVHQFDTGGKLASIADTNGNTVTLAYTSGNLTSVTDPYGRQLVLTYSSGKIASVTDAASRTWTLTYDGSGRLQYVYDPVLAGQTYRTAFAYGASNNVTGVTNRQNKTWTYSYGTNSTFLTTTDPLNQTAGQDTEETSPEQEDQEQFDSGHGGTQNPDPNPETYPVNTVATVYVEDAAGNPAEFGVDAQGRITASRDGNGQQTNYTYDSSYNRTTVVETGGATTTRTFDARGNETQVTDPTSRTLTRTYDTQNNLLTETDGNNETTTYTYDSASNRTSVTDATNNTSTYVYGTGGKLTSITDPAGKTTTFGYDSNGNRTTETDPLSNVATNTYTVDKLATRTDARGRTTSYSYDAWGRLQGIDYPTSTDQTFTLDVEGRMTQSVDATGTRTYTYDDAGRKTGQTDPRGNTTAAYDPAGRLDTQTDVSGRTLSYDYDPNGRLSTIGDGTTSATHTYDARGRIATTTYSNGVNSTYGYDSASRTTSIVHRSALNVVLASYSATYDTAGRLYQVTESPGSSITTYTYDDAGRILTETRTGTNPYSSTYTYNSRGRRATAVRVENGVNSHNGTYTYDNAGRLTQVTDTVANSGAGGTYTYNADGTLASMTVDGVERRFTYDEEKRVIEIGRYASGTYTAREQFGYGFDGGRRWAKNLSANKWTWYPCGVACCAGQLVEMESTLAGTTWTTTVQSVSATDTVSRNGEILLPAIGVRGKTVNAAGSVVRTETRDSSSVVRGSSGSASSSAVAFTGALSEPDAIPGGVLGANGTLALTRVEATSTASTALVALDPWIILLGCIVLKMAQGLSFKDALAACNGVKPVDPLNPPTGPTNPPGGPGTPPTTPPTPVQPLPELPKNCPKGTAPYVIVCPKSSGSGCAPIGVIMSCDPTTGYPAPVKL